jgi:hypothetical protein
VRLQCFWRLLPRHQLHQRLPEVMHTLALVLNWFPTVCLGLWVVTGVVGWIADRFQAAAVRVIEKVARG